MLIFLYFCSEKGSSGHGILEFNTDKAGQDVTPLNLEFEEPKQRSSTFNSITGKDLGKCSLGSSEDEEPEETPGVINSSFRFLLYIILSEECFYLHEFMD